MSSEIESKIVEMRFDNKKFESNVQTSLSTIEKLKKSLKFTGLEKGFENINEATKNCKLSNLGNVIDGIGAKFSAFSVIGVTALANITNSAVNAGKKIMSALTIDPIKTGFEEYETKMGSIQTIMSNTASKGTTMQDVINVIDELNTYADKTIYNFSEMTRNIGTFTAAGVGLKESASAIQGIANLAAASGSNSQQASTAMYQLSQALSAGTVKLMDWNSVVNAGMGGEKFQEALKSTAREHGIAVDEMIKNNGSFRESLQEGWITADVLNETLNKFTVDGAKNYAKSMIDSGKWTQAQADALIAEAQSMEDAATKVKTFTQLWDTLKESAQSGWGQTWELIVGNFDEAKDFFSNASDVLGNLISASADARNKLITDWKNLGGRTVLIDSIKNAFEGVMSVIKPIKEAFREIFPPITAQQLYNFTNGIKDLTSKLILSSQESEKLKNACKGIFSVVKTGIKIIENVAVGFGKLIKSLAPVKNGIKSIYDSISEFINKTNDALYSTTMFSDAFDMLESIISPLALSIGKALDYISNGIRNLGGISGIIEKVIDGIEYALGKVKNIVSNLIKNLGFDSILDIVNGGLLTGLLLGIKKIIKMFSDFASNGPGVIGSIKDILDGVSGSLQDFQSKLKSDTLLKIAKAIGILAASLVVLSMIDESKLTSSLGAITGLFIELFGSMTIFDKLVGGSGFKSIGKVSRAMVGISASILILSFAMENLSSLSWEEIGRGLTAVSGGLAILVMAVKALPENKKTVGLIGLSTSLLILSGALKIFATMSWEEIGKGLTTLAGSLLILVGSMQLMKSSLAGATSILIISSALIVLSGALKIFATMSWEEIGKGLTTLAGSLLILVGSMQLMKSSLAGATSILIISSALIVLSGALKIFATMSWEEIGKGLTTLAGSLLIFAGATALMTTALPGAASILIISGALAILTPVLMALSTMSWEGIAKGLVSISGAFAVIGVAGLLLGPISPLILALGAAVALLGVGCLAAGAGLLAFSTGLSALAVSGTAGVSALITIIEEVVGMIPSIASAVGSGIVELVRIIAEKSESVTSAFVKIFNSILQSIINIVPKISETVKIILINILDVISDITPKIVDTVITCLSAILDSVVNFVPKMVESGLLIITGFLQGIADNISGVVEAGVNIITNFLTAIGNETPRIVDAGFNMIIDFINGLCDAISQNTPKLSSAIENLIQTMMETGIKVIKGAISGFTSAGREIINGFIEGMRQKISDVANMAANMAKNALSAAKKALGIASPSRAFIAIGKYIGEGLAQGIRDSSWNAVYETEEMATKIVEVASKTFEDVEKYISDAKHFDELSLNEELEIWEEFISRQAEGSEERLKAEKNAYTIYKSLVDEQYQNSMDWIEQEKYYKRLSLEEELAAYERVQSRYEWGSEKWLKMEREKYRMKNEIEDTSYQNSMDWIEQEKYYKRLSLYGELAAYKRVQSRYAENTDEYKKMSKEIFRIQNEINDANEKFYKESIRIQEEYQTKKIDLEKEYEDKVKEINKKLEDDIKAANDSYSNAVKSRTKTLYDSYKLFDKVDPKEKIDSSSLFTNLQSQVDAFKDWKQDINELSDKGINKTLLEELQEMGPSSAAEIKALNELSSHELNDYVKLWQEKYTLAEKQAKIELADVKEDTKNQIRQLKADAKIELDEYTKTWDDKMSELRDNMKEQLSDIRKEWIDSVGIIKDETDSEFTMMTQNIASIIGEENSWSELGSNIINGLMKGIINTEGHLLDYVRHVMENMKQVAAESVDSHSPSKDFAKLGIYCMQGLVAGIKNGMFNVMDSVHTVGKNVIDSFTSAISNISLAISEGIDYEPTISPVLDLSNIQNGTKFIDGILSPNRSIGLGLSLGGITNSQNLNNSFSGFKDVTIESNDKIVKAIDSLKNDVSNLSDAIYNMKLVMDTGTLVGAISSEIDNSLGRISTYNKRGM